MKYQGLREIFKVTEWRESDGVKAVFKTKKIGFAWITIGTEPEKQYDGNIQFHSISTNLMKELNHKTNRTVSDDTPDIDITTAHELGLY
jgi:hypothetical protein